MEGVSTQRRMENQIGGGEMINWLKRTFVLSEQGAKDLNRAIWCCTATNIGLLLPVALTCLVLSEWISPYFGVYIKSLPFAAYVAMSVGILFVIYGLEYIQYNVTFSRSNPAGLLLSKSFCTF